MNTPYWITEIQEINESYSRGKEKFGIQIDAGDALLKVTEAYTKMREAVEKAPHERGCPAARNPIMADPEPCSCGKSKALNYDPTKEVN